MNSTQASQVPPGATQLPAFDNTLGALFIGFIISVLLYGATVIQTFIYATSGRSQLDKMWLRLLVLVVFVGSSANFSLSPTSDVPSLKTDFGSPAALIAKTNDAHRMLGPYQGIVAGTTIFFVQLFFCWRIWVFLSLHKKSYAIPISVVAVLLSLTNFASWMGAIALLEREPLVFFGQQAPVKLKSFWLVSTLSGLAADFVIMITTTLSLQKARSGFSRSVSNHAITIISMFMFNTNLLTTLVNVSMLVTFLVLPGTGIWAGIALVDMKIFVNSFLAVLNSREYLREFKPEESLPLSPSSITGTNFVLDIGRHTEKEGSVV